VLNKADHLDLTPDQYTRYYPQSPLHDAER
jgi:hypothetical protein